MQFLFRCWWIRETERGDGRSPLGNVGICTTGNRFAAVAQVCREERLGEGEVYPLQQVLIAGLVGPLLLVFIDVRPANPLVHGTHPGRLLLDRCARPESGDRQPTNGSM